MKPNLLIIWWDKPFMNIIHWDCPWIRFKFLLAMPAILSEAIPQGRDGCTDSNFGSPAYQRINDSRKTG